MAGAGVKSAFCSQTPTWRGYEAFDANSRNREKAQLMANGASDTDQSAEAKLRKFEEAEKRANIHLAKFDDLDFNVFTNQDWIRLHESHAEDIVVHWPDGRQVKGIKPHNRGIERDVRLCARYAHSGSSSQDRRG
jgi:hypothetical protein